ncbi:leu/Ile/Val-binding protein homolog 3 [Brucella sp. NBRC 12952]|uniref:Branched-chain amino acid ABC transporter substrate-binding protein n=2 Tax=Brucella pseudogrignonensis TaxID=419475 RepID=A0A7Y3T8T6_9HYPH|nr:MULTISPECIES: amino acid ABC transporter substrate-binding protein [Brucella]NNV22998.1 branched-chain amino acid ABC transporter substrate-binding protein [Brucella pseudogrignonensis]
MNRRNFLMMTVSAIGFAAIGLDAQAAEPFKVGITVSNSGNFMLASQSGERGVRMWVDDVNRRGGIELGGEKRPVELVVLDDRSDKTMVPRVYETLISGNNVDVLMAPFGSTLTGVAATVAERNNKFLMSWSASADEIYQQGYKNIVSAVVPSSLIPSTNLRLLNDAGVKKIAIIHVDESFPAGLAAAAVKDAKEMGFEVVMDETYQKGTKDFSVLLQKAKALGAEAFYPHSYEVDSVLMARQMQELDIHFDNVYFMYGSTPQFLELGKLAEFVTSHTQYSPNAKWDITDGLKNEEFVTRYKELFPKVSYSEDFQTVLAYGAAVALERLVSEAQSTDPAALKQKALEMGGKITTISGKFAIDETGKQIGMEPIVLQNQPGKGLVPVAPAEVATEKLIYPVPQ